MKATLGNQTNAAHLGILRDSGVVDTRRAFQSGIYSLRPGIVTNIIGLLHDEFCPRQPGRTRRSLA